PARRTERAPEPACHRRRRARERSAPAPVPVRPRGPGSLPAFRAMTVDCGARAGRARLDPDGPLFLTGYGCDRFALFQVEYIGSLDIDFDFGFDDRRDRRLGRSTAARRGADK